MKSKHSGKLYLPVALALLAGALGGVLAASFVGNNDQRLTDSPGDQAEEPKLSAKVIDPLFDGGDPLPETIDDMRLALQEATAERNQLAGVLAQLTQKLDVIESDFINQQSRQTLNVDAEENTDLSIAGDREPRNRADHLVAAGIDVSTADLLQSQLNDYQLQRLDLIDLAEREGWRNSDQFRERMRELNEQRPHVREEIGEDAYDRYLYEAGRNNRVLVDSIIEGSAAYLAGLQVGDVIIDYADARVFSRRELQSATRDGSRGESIIMTIQRQGQSVIVEVPRGPLGVGLDAEQQNPS